MSMPRKPVSELDFDETADVLDEHFYDEHGGITGRCSSAYTDDEVAQAEQFIHWANADFSRRLGR